MKIKKFLGLRFASVWMLVGLLALGLPSGRVSAAPVDIQAETCTISQGLVEANHAGYTGSGFVNYNNVTGSYVQCAVSASTAGTYRLEFRYANGTTINRPAEIRVNGAVVSANLAFNGTGAWATWATVTLDVALSAGSNTVRITATTANGGPNLDRLRVDLADSQPPTAPSNPRVSNLTCSSATFAWDAATDNTGVAAYDVFHDGQFVTSVGGTTLSTSITVVPNATWDLYVQARDAAGNVSQSSASVRITPPPCADDTTPPTAPSNLTGSANGTTVSLSWGASSDAVGVVAYDVFRVLNGTTTQAGSVTGRPPATTFTDSGLAASTTYQYYVVARDAKPNLSPRSNQISVTTAAACGQPVCAATQVASDTDVPWGLLTLPDGSVLFSQRDAKQIIRLVPSSGQKTSTGTVPNVSGTDGEGGLMGLEINPVSFASDRWVYIMHTSPTDNRVVRMRLTTSNTLDQASHQVLLTGIGRNKYHDGGRLRFSPDGQFLFVSTGDAQNTATAQDVNNLSGKILRIRPDGSIPSDNPFGNAVWSYGHRNPQGLAFDAQGQLWQQEFGNSVMDETNLIVKGGNYGWPACEGTTGSCSNPNYIAPKQTYSTAAGSCSGIAIVRGALYVACLRGERLYRLTISGSSLTGLTTHFQGSFGRLRTVEPAPDGGLWVTTSNGDKDSIANNSTTRIYRVALGQ
ncbi:MAG TPA: PQQ-dependent sugar dehydrogenase [Roseiflexaceae bacterium]|nr:PQQ-dependent sugar dehydrogenase [Roseiflexaceae bacterium]